MMGLGEEFTTKRNDTTRRIGGVAMVHDGGVSSFEVVDYGETINLVEQA